MYAYLDNAYLCYKESLINRARLALVDDARMKAWIAEQHTLLNRCAEWRQNWKDVYPADQDFIAVIDANNFSIDLRKAADRRMLGTKPQNAREKVYSRELEAVRNCILTIRDFHDGLQCLVDIAMEQDSIKRVQFGNAIRQITDDMVRCVVARVDHQCALELQEIS